MPIAHRRGRHPFWRAVGYLVLTILAGGVLLLAAGALFLGAVLIGTTLVEAAS